MPTAQCAEFENRIHDLLDQRLPLDQDNELKQHASICPHCAEVLSDYRGLDFAISFDNPVVSKCQHSESIRIKDPSTESRVKALISLAALMLIGMSFVFAFSKPAGHSTDLEVAKHTPTVPARRDFRIDEYIGIGIPDIAAIPEFVDPVGPYTQVDWNHLSETLRPLSAYYHLSAELPGIRPLHTSIGWTFDWFQQTFFGSEKGGKNLGRTTPPPALGWDYLA